MKEVKTEEAPAAVGPYSQAVVAGDFVFCSGQIGLNPATGTLVSGGVEAEAEQALKNLKAVLKEAGVSTKDVTMVTVYLTDIHDFSVVNTTYEKYFNETPRPARATVGVAALPKSALVEISCVAYKR